MRDKKGRFVKGHNVPKDWKIRFRKARRGKPNPKNRYPRTERQLEVLRTVNIGREPWNKGIGSFKFNCAVCGKEVVSNGAIRKYKFCSKECSYLYSHIMRGENHWNYKGKNNRLQRCWSEYREWHRKVLKKDNYICQVCGRRGGKLQAHHIKSFAKYPKLRFVVENGMAVCRKCHLKEIHNWKLNE